jgi:hypothetical protein
MAFPSMLGAMLVESLFLDPKRPGLVKQGLEIPRPACCRELGFLSPENKNSLLTEQCPSPYDLASLHLSSSSAPPAIFTGL